MTTALFNIVGPDSEADINSVLGISTGQGGVTRCGADLKAAWLKQAGSAAAVRERGAFVLLQDNTQLYGPETTSLVGVASGFALTAVIPSLTLADIKERLGLGYATQVAEFQFQAPLLSLLPRMVRLVGGLGPAWPAFLTLGAGVVGIGVDYFKADVGVPEPS